MKRVQKGSEREEGPWAAKAGRVLCRPEQMLKDRILYIVMGTATGGGTPLMQDPE